MMQGNHLYETITLFLTRRWAWSVPLRVAPVVQIHASSDDRPIGATDELHESEETNRDAFGQKHVERRRRGDGRMRLTFETFLK